jgi:hypothetical protein
MSAEEAATRYREKNKGSARTEMDFVRLEVARLVEGVQVIEVLSAPLCTNPLSVAFKIKGDCLIKKRLVIDLSRWVNKFVILDSFVIKIPRSFGPVITRRLSIRIQYLIQ